MRKKLKVTVMVLGALAALVGLGATIFNPVSASAAPAAAFTVAAGRGPGGHVDAADLAAALGITEDELAAAQQEAYAAGLQQAVDTGTITQAQADEMSAGSADTGRGGRGDSRLSRYGVDYDALLAQALGISVTDLQAAQAAAVTAGLEQAVADGSMTQEQADLIQAQNALRADSAFQTALKSAYESAVNAAVKAGVITQAQADLVLANQSAGFNGGHGMMDGDGFGGRGGGGRGGPKTAPVQP